MAVLGKCCCCDLKTGVIILGVLSLIIPVIGAIICSWVLILLAATTIAVTQSDDLNNAVQDEWDKRNNDGDASLDFFVGLGIGAGVAGVALVIFIFYIIVSSLLIHGARKGKPGLLYPYLAVTVLSMIFSVGSFINSCIAAGSFLVGNLISMIVSLALQTFFFLCVFSLSQEMKQEMQLQQGGVGMQKL